MTNLSAAAVGAEPVQLPLAVDLDGTLIRSDVLYETVALLLRRNPLYLLLLPFWLAQGKAQLKRQIASRVTLDVAALPYRSDVLGYLNGQARGGRRLLLATTTDETIANQVACHLGIFSEVLASDGRTNLKGSAKAARLRALLGDRHFAYAGNDRSDLPVWEVAAARVVVSRDRRLTRRVAAMGDVEAQFEPAGGGLRHLARALRFHQWVKNLLVFIPMLAAHELGLEALTSTMLAFVAFGLVASAGYLVNDLVDVEFDRHHERKRHRPLASGALDFRLALLSIPVLVVAGVGIGYAISWAVALALLSYLAASHLYSFRLKRIALADVFTLAILYTSRIVVGAVAAGVPISHWLLAFSVFFFLFLSFVKRYSELNDLRARNHEAVKGRGYLVSDLELLPSLGAASGFVAVLVLALYINSPDVAALYRTPDALWLVCLVLLYWVSRVWIIAHRGAMDDDPIVFALKDRTSYFALALCAAAVAVAWVVR